MNLRVPFTVLAVVGGLSLVALAGSLTPSALPGSTMNSFSELYSSIVGTFDSSGISSSQNGSLIQSLKYIETNLSHGNPTNISVRESGGAFSHVASFSFEQSSFDISNTASASLVKLDWINGPASRSAAQTISGRWSFSQAVSISQNFELSNGYASISNTLFISSLGNIGIGNVIPAVKLDITGTASISGNLSVGGYISNKGSNATSQEFGYMASATAAGSQAMGKRSLATGTNALALGFGAVASGNTGSMALGQGAKAFAAGANAVTIGRAALGRSSSVVVLGATAEASVGTSNVAIGFGAESSGSFGTVAIGKLAKPGSAAVAIGNNAYSAVNGGDVIGGLASDSNSGGEVVGYRATTLANGATLGTLAFGAFGDVAIGANSIAGAGNLAIVAIGYLANSPAAFQIVTAIGYNVQAAGANSVIIGANALNAGTGGIAIGDAASASGGEFVAGSSVMPITNVYFGLGRKSSAPVAYTLNGTMGSGTNISGAGITLAGGRGTGLGVGGSISFQTAPAGGSGTTLGTLQTRMTISSRGMIGVGTVAPRNLFSVTDTTIGSVATGSFTINSSNILGSVASLSGISLAGGSIFNITVPASTSANNPHGLMLVQDVNGVTIASWSMGGSLSLAGKILSDGANSSCTGVNVGGTGCIDYAESYPTTDQSLQAGDVVMVDQSQSANVQKANNTNTPLGIVSTNPAVLIDGGSFKSGSAAKASLGTIPLALSGRVPVRISQENGPILPGDHLTVSATIPGAAMKQTQAGMSVGIALEPSIGAPTLMTFVNTGWWGGDISTLVALDPVRLEHSSLLRSGIGQVFDGVVQRFLAMFHIGWGDGLVQAGHIALGTLQTDQLCIQEVCVDREHLVQLLAKHHIQQ